LGVEIRGFPFRQHHFIEKQRHPRPKNIQNPNSKNIQNPKPDGRRSKSKVQSHWTLTPQSNQPRDPHVQAFNQKIPKHGPLNTALSFGRNRTKSSMP
jgi:hypothetical protein